MKKWRILEKGGIKKIENIDQVISILFNNRNLKTPEEITRFLTPDINNISIDSIGIDQKEVIKFKKRVERAIVNSESIVIFGDYDVDGICGSAILWETLFSKSKKVTPYIPDRIDEGYGLSVRGIDNVLKNNPDVKLIITVDNGIVANDAVEYAKTKGIDVIITDHHVKGKILPKALSILHTTSLCGAGIAWVIAKELDYEQQDKIEEKLGLACLATIADLVPLKEANRAIVKKGLEILSETKRPGLRELLRDAGIEKSAISVHAVGHIIAPRLNATGRIQSAMNSLRLLCTNNLDKAKELSRLLSTINKDRQGLTEESVAHAKLLAVESSYSTRINIVADKSYNQGVIGLIASHLVESYYKPSFAISIGGKISKGSARSIAGVNIIELLRSVSDSLVEAGGHPMAAGFSIETHRIEEFSKALAKKAETIITDEILDRYITIDMELSFNLITKELVERMSKLSPFGMANPEPVFATYDVEVLEMRRIGRDQNHLKFVLGKEEKVFDAVAFRMADKVDIIPGDKISIAYTVEENEWKGRANLQLKIRDIMTN